MHCRHSKTGKKPISQASSSKQLGRRRLLPSRRLPLAFIVPLGMRQHLVFVLTATQLLRTCGQLTYTRMISERGYSPSGLSSWRTDMDAAKSAP